MSLFYPTFVSEIKMVDMKKIVLLVLMIFFIFSYKEIKKGFFDGFFKENHTEASAGRNNSTRSEELFPRIYLLKFDVAL
jgi:hypothetical protein